MFKTYVLRYLCLNNDVINLDIIKTKRRSLKISQKEMSEKVFCSITAYQNYENGLRTFPEDILRKACEILALDYQTVVSAPISVNDPAYVLALQINDLDPDAVNAIKVLVEKLKNK